MSWSSRPDFSSPWFVWDGGYYDALVRNGYPDYQPERATALKTAVRRYVVGQPLESPSAPFDYRQHYSVFATMPAYPFFSRLIFRVIGGSSITAAVFVANVFVVLSAFLLYLLVRLDFSERSAMLAAVFYLVQPFSPMMSSVMSESTFNLSFIGALLCARQRRWTLAALLASVATLSRLYGALVLVSVGIALYRVASDRREALRGYGMIVTCSALVAAWFVTWLYLLTGDPLTTLHALRPWHPHPFKMSVLLAEFSLYNRLNVAAWTFPWLALLWGYGRVTTDSGEKFPAEYLAYGVLFLIIIAARSNLVCSARYTVSNIPVAIVAGCWLSRRRWPWIPLTASFLCSVWVMSYWTRIVLWLI